MNKAYTLLEILVVVTMLLLLTGAGTMGYARTNVQRKLQKDADAFTDILNTARQKTIDRDLGTSTTCDPFDGYRVRVIPASSSFELYRVCGGSPDPVIATYQLSTGIFDASGSFNIDFEYPYGSLRGPEQVVIIKKTSVGQCKQIRIYTTGIISEEFC